MKKFLSVMLGLATAASCFAVTGCGQTIDPNALVIEYYKAGYGDTWIKNLAAEYTRLYGQDVVLLPREGVTGLSALKGSLTSGTSETDLFFADSPDFSEIYRGEISIDGQVYDSWFADLTDMYESTIEGEDITVENKMLDYFQEYFKMPYEEDDDGEELYYSESYHFFPYVTGMFGFVVNVDVWNQVAADKEYPRTTDELIELCDTFKATKAPFLYSVSEEYWTESLPLFMHQYEGDAEMNRYYEGYGPGSDVPYDFNMVAYDGFKYALQFFERLLTPANGYMHPYCASYNFTQMQGLFLEGESLFCVNGDWLENEMKINYPDANIAMMKTPVLSAVANKCSFAGAANADEILRAAIDFVDGNAAAKPAECSEDDMAIIRNAREVEYVTGCSNSAFIASYSNQIPAAKNFLRMMASDEGMKIFREGTNGSEMPFRYTDSANAADPQTQTVFRQSINNVLSVSAAKFVNKKDKIFSVGGIKVQLFNNALGRFSDAFKDGKATADQYFRAEVDAVNSALPGAKQQAGL